MMKKLFKQRQLRNNALIGIAIVAVGLSSYFILKTNIYSKNVSISKIQSIQYSEVFKNFDPETKIIKNYKSKEKIKEDILIINKDNNSIPFSNDWSQAYIVSLEIQKSNMHYIDLDFIVNLGTNNMKAQISGLKPHQKISLRIDEKNIFKEIPADWSGQITLSSVLSDSLNHNKICTTFYDSNTHPESICHYTANIGGSA